MLDFNILDCKYVLSTLQWYASKSGHASKNNMSNDIINFTILKFFDVQARPRKASRIEQVNWCMPSVGWVKVNPDGVARGCPGHVDSVDIFKGSVWNTLVGIYLCRHLNSICKDYGCYFDY